MRSNFILLLFVIVVFTTSCAKPDVLGKDEKFTILISSVPVAEEIFNKVADGTLTADDLEGNMAKLSDTSNYIIQSAYYAALSYTSNVNDNIVEYSFKSVSYLSKAAGDSFINIPDTLIRSMGHNYSDGKAYYLSQLALVTYDSLPEYSLYFSKKAADSHLEVNNLPWAAFSYLNQSTLYDGYGDYESAISLADSAIEIWKTVGDSSQLANLFKYKGLLLGKLGRFDEGKLMINEAFRIYNRIKFEPGKFVSLHDLGELYLLENDNDSSMFCFLNEKNYWKQVNDTQRLFISNISLIKAHDAKGDKENVIKIIIENDGLINCTVLSDVNRKVFMNLKIEMQKKYGNWNEKAGIIKTEAIKSRFESVQYSNVNAIRPEYILNYQI